MAGYNEGIGTITRRIYCSVCVKTYELKTPDVGITEALKRPKWFDIQCGHLDHQFFKGLKKNNA